MKARAIALACVLACGGQKTTTTAPVASASASATSAPVQQSGDAGVGQIDPNAVRNVIRAANARFILCYVQGLKKDKKLAGRVETKFVIDETGHVISAEDVTKSNVLQDDSTRDCIVSKFRQLEFPPPQPSGKVPITYPLLLDPSMVTIETADAGAPVETPINTHEHRTFNPTSVGAAFTKVDTKACGFHGSGHLKLTFEPSGVVSKVEIDAPATLAGTPMATCLTRAYGKATVPAFDGNAVTIGKSFNVP